MLAAGSQANFFDTQGAEQYTFPLYSLEEAERLRSRVLAVFEDADRNPKLVDEGALNFVIVGGGPTGTELAGALADMINLTMTREYTDLAVKRARRSIWWSTAIRCWRHFPRKPTSMRRALFSGRACSCASVWQ